MLLATCGDLDDSECVAEEVTRLEAKLEHHELAQATMALDALLGQATEWHAWRAESERQRTMRQEECSRHADCTVPDHDYSVEQVPDRFQEALSALGKFNNLVSSDRYRSRLNDLYNDKSENAPLHPTAAPESVEARVRRELSTIIATAYALAGEELGFHPARLQQDAMSACNGTDLTTPASLDHD
jgi:hypothetical protein